MTAKKRYWKECYAMKLELLTNATVVDDAIRFVSEYSKVSSIKRVEADKEVEEAITHKVF
jgi:hypothetical protein